MDILVFEERREMELLIRGHELEQEKELGTPSAAAVIEPLSAGKPVGKHPHHEALMCQGLFTIRLEIGQGDAIAWVGHKDLICCHNVLLSEGKKRLTVMDQLSTAPCYYFINTRNFTEVKNKKGLGDGPVK
jgi:hypothetical protein